MIPCQECGHINRLGALYCAACGAKLSVDIADIEESVVRSGAEQRADAFLTAGRNLLVFSIFLVIAAWGLHAVIIPAMPAMRMPPGKAMPASELFPADVAWLQRQVVRESPLRLEDFNQQGFDSLADWRRQHRDQLLNVVNQQRVEEWQVEVFNSQQADGSWSGSDPVAATGMGLLALLARPGLPDFEQAIERGVTVLKPQVLRGSAGRSPIAHTIGIMALVESGLLNQREEAQLRSALYRGDAPAWQALALLSFAPERRPTRIAAIRANTTEPLWRHYLHFLSEQPLIEEVDQGLFRPGAAAALVAEERLAWALLSLWMGRNVNDLKTTLQAWSNEELPPAVSPELRELVGVHAGHAMAILNACAPLRAPAAWVRPPPEAP